MAINVLQNLTIYLLGSSFIQGIIFLVVSVIVASLIPVSGFYVYKNRISKYLCFNLILLIVGIPGNLFWRYFVFRRIYSNGDYLFGYLPYIFPGEWTLDRACNGHFLDGYSFPTLWIYWSIISFFIWLITVTLYLKRQHYVENHLTNQLT